MKMKKIFTCFTFFFAMASLLTIASHITGGDPHGIVLFELNPFLNVIRYSDFADNVINVGPKLVTDSLIGEISIYWYIIHFISLVVFGFILDTIKYFVKKYVRYCRAK